MTSEAFDPCLLKSLFSRLVAACGRQDAAAARLGISRQRVSQLCSASEDHARDVPTWEQVWTLEHACGRSLVFGAMANLIDPPASFRGDVVVETHEVVLAAAQLLPLALAVKAGKPGAQAAFETAVQTLVRRVGGVEAVANVIPMRGAA